MQFTTTLASQHLTLAAFFPSRIVAMQILLREISQPPGRVIRRREQLRGTGKREVVSIPM